MLYQSCAKFFAHPVKTIRDKRTRAEIEESEQVNRTFGQMKRRGALGFWQLRKRMKKDEPSSWLITKDEKEQGRIHGNPVADSRAGAVVRKLFGIQKVTLPTDRPTDTARCRVACPRLKTTYRKIRVPGLEKSRQLLLQNKKKYQIREENHLLV